MKIKITYRCRVDGKEYFPGDFVDTSKGVALDRIGMGRAKLYTPPPEEQPPAETQEGGEVVESGAVDSDESKKRKRKEK